MDNSDLRPYEKLAHAIIIEATKDYRRALKKLKKDPQSKSVQGEVKKLELFFYGDWFGELTELNPKWLVSQMKKEVGYDDSQRNS